MYDLMIIGSGPAGISAALTAKARNLNFIWFGSRALSTKIEKAEKIMNYPGLPAVTGSEMQSVFLKQIDDCDITITEAQVNSIYDCGGYFAASADNEIYEAKSVIMTVGMTTTREIEGEARLLGCGVSYCATCDGALYKNKDIAVICASPKFEDEVTFLAGLANHIYLFTPYKETELKCDNITHYHGFPASVDGDKKVASVTFKGEAIPVNGAFFLKDSINPGVLLSGLDMAGGHIIVDRTQKTNIDGVYAAGDCTGRPYQYAKAVGEGNVAVHSVLEYLKEHKDN